MHTNVDISSLAESDAISHFESFSRPLSLFSLVFFFIHSIHFPKSPLSVVPLPLFSRDQSSLEKKKKKYNQYPNPFLSLSFPSLPSLPSLPSHSLTVPVLLSQKPFSQPSFPAREPSIEPISSLSSLSCLLLPFHLSLSLTHSLSCSIPLSLSLTLSFFYSPSSFNPHSTPYFFSSSSFFLSLCSLHFPILFLSHSQPHQSLLTSLISLSLLFAFFLSSLINHYPFDTLNI